jgi:hypothetical protein
MDGPDSKLLQAMYSTSRALASRGWVVLTAMFASSAVAAAQSGGPISVDLSAAGPEGTPAQFTVSRTGEGENGKWTLVGDPTAVNGRAIAQVSTDRTDYRFPLAIYQTLLGHGPRSVRALQASRGSS